MLPLNADDPRHIAGFDLMNRIGAGGMGMVFLGRRRTDGRLAAVKLIRNELLADDDTRARFDREMVAARRVVSPRVATVLDAGFDEGTPFLAVDFVQGPTLREAIAKDGPLTGHALMQLADGLADALIAMHEVGLVHRDLTPRNILLTHLGPCVIDFGIARMNDSVPLTSTGLVIGTAGYIAPERLLRSETLPSGDVFSVGAVLLLAATGRPPFGDGDPMEIHFRVTRGIVDTTGVPPALASIVRACLAPEPVDRPDARRLKQLIQAAHLIQAAPPPSAGGSPVPIAPTKQVPVTRHPSGRPGLASPSVAGGPRPTAVYVAAAVAVIILAGAGIFAALHDWGGNAHAGGRHGKGGTATQSNTPTHGGTANGRTPTARSTPSSGSTPTASGTATTSSTGQVTPGTYPVNRPFYNSGGLVLTLTVIEVNDDNTVKATVQYKNTGTSTRSFSCLSEAIDPSETSLELSGGRMYEASSSYCSDHPLGLFSLGAGGTKSSYATFDHVSGAKGPYTFTWQSGDDISGNVSDIEL